MRETDPVDIAFILSSLETLARYDDVTIDRLNQVYATIAEWAGTSSQTMDDPSVLMSGDYELLDEGESESTIDLTYGTPTKLEPAQPILLLIQNQNQAQNLNLNQEAQGTEPEPEPAPEPQPALPNNVVTI